MVFPNLEKTKRKITPPGRVQITRHSNLVFIKIMVRKHSHAQSRSIIHGHFARRWQQRLAVTETVGPPKPELLLGQLPNPHCTSE